MNLPLLANLEMGAKWLRGEVSSIRGVIPLNCKFTNKIKLEYPLGTCIH